MFHRYNQQVVIDSSPSFHIENATWRDLKPLQRLEKICFDVDAWPLLELLGVLTFPDVLRLKAVADGIMVGFIAGDRRRGEMSGDTKVDTGWILTLGVLPDWRRIGIAEALLMECEKQLRMPVIKLTVRRGNQPAIRLYEKLGYSQIDIWSKYYRNGEDGLVFEKQLEDADALA
jgi:ribosomal-protein-alanine N-acetyltransferase